MTFQSFGGCIERVFLTNECLLNNFVGNQLWMFGSGFFGRLGTDDTIARSSPVQTISANTNWRNVRAGADHTVSLKTDSSVWTWGRNNYGQLGDNTTIDKSSPVQVSNGGCWRRIDVSKNCTFSVGFHSRSGGIKTDGSLWMWGSNLLGSLGVNDTIHRSTPVSVGTSTNWLEISIGTDTTAGIKTDGTLWTWGRGDLCQLGNINFIQVVSSPIQVVAPAGTTWKSVSIGTAHGGAIRSDGTLWLWGNGQYGRLGHGLTASRSSPVQTTAGGSNWKQVSSGRHHTLALTTDGQLWAFGRNQCGQLGSGTTINQCIPVRIGSNNNWKLIEANYQVSGAIKADGSLWVWGCNNYSAGIINSNVCYSSPVQLATNKWKSISMDSRGTAAVSFIE